MRYTDPDGRDTDSDTEEKNKEDTLSSINIFLTCSDTITAFFFSICQALNKGELYTKAVIAGKFNELGLAEGMVSGFMAAKGDPFVEKLLSNQASKVSNVFLAVTIILDVIDVLLVYRNSNGDADATAKRIIRDAVTTAATILAGKFGGAVGSAIGTLVAPGGGTIIGTTIGAIGFGLATNVLLNKKFDEMGW